MITDIITTPCAKLSGEIKFIEIRQGLTSDELIVKRAAYVPEIEIIFTVQKLWAVIVRCTAAGSYGLFGVSSSAIVHEKEFRHGLMDCYYSLQSLTSTEKIIDFIEHYLLIRKSNCVIKSDLAVITWACETLMNYPGEYSMQALAAACNISLKTFQRKFVEYIGILPKMFERVYRLQNLIDKKRERPWLRLTSLCYEVGYFDQNHMIKEFRAFTGRSPSDFFCERIAVV